MSRARAITTRLESIVEALTPETPLSAPRFKYVSGATTGNMQLRQFAISSTGDVQWFDEYPQDMPGSQVREGFEIIVSYGASHPDRNIRDVIREDVLAIQQAILRPDNWDEDTTASDLREVGGFSVEFTAINEQQAGLEVTIPVTVRYRPY